VTDSEKESKGFKAPKIGDQKKPKGRERSFWGDREKINEEERGFNIAKPGEGKRRAKYERRIGPVKTDRQTAGVATSRPFEKGWVAKVGVWEIPEAATESHARGKKGAPRKC